MRKTAIIALIAPMLVAAALLGGTLLSTGTASAQTTTADYDDDNDGLIDVGTLAQLNAIRYDLDGNGDATDAVYIAAFPSRDTSSVGRMGCPSGTCAGYELRANLDFDTDGDGATYTTSSAGVVTGDAGDTYYNGGSGWTPLGSFSATFEGNAYTVSNLYINLSTTGNNEGNYVGMFGDLAATGVIRNVGLVNPYVANARGGAGYSGTGALAGRNNGGTVSGSYVAGGSVVGNQRSVPGAWVTSPMTGCLVGYNLGAVSDSYATCAATATGTDDASDTAGGLVGGNSGTVRDSHAAGTVAGDVIAGGLVGVSFGNGLVSDSYATGAVSASDGDTVYAGGLVGLNFEGADVIGSYATGAVSASDFGRFYYVGGLAGYSGTSCGGMALCPYPGNAGGNRSPQVRASYATGTVSTSGGNGNAGGLVGWLSWGGSIDASYATGAVSASGGFSNRLGGLVGRASEGATSVANSYWDTQTSGQSASAAGVGKTTSELQSPTGYTGIYAGWNLNLDGQTGDDDPWYFGAANQYPVLRYGDHDWDDDGLIEVNRLAKLDAVRWDLNGDGSVDTGTSVADTAKYRAAFAGAATGMGCLRDHDANTATAKVAGCVGYELTLDLDFDTDGDGATYTTSSTGTVTGDAGDTYYNGGGGWTPIGGHQETANQDFTATFEGNGYTVSNLYINLSTTGDSEGNYVGLFGDLTAAATIRNVGLVDPYVANTRGGAGYSRTGALAGRNNGGAVSGSYVSGGSVASNQGTVVAVAFPMAGCLLGYSQGAVSDSYATCTATATGADDAVDRAGGLIGWNSGTVRDSYAAGTVAGDLQAGGLVGFSSGSNGLVTDSYATGAVSASAAGGYAGGLVGFNNAGADVIGSYATGAVLASGSGSYVGGLLGKAGSLGTQVRASYATGAVSTSGDNGNAGGLVGWLDEGATIVASYATGAVSASGGGTNHLGGLLASIQISSSSVTVSYWDTQTSGQTASAAGVGKTTSELQSPTGYTGIYAGWNLNLDGQSGNDDPWHFGTGSQYPVLRYGGQDYHAQRGDYDWDDDGLIEVNSLAKLDAIRGDLNGDGAWDRGDTVADAVNNIKHRNAFTGASAGMGCRWDHDANAATPKVAGCIGYELTANLDFDENNDGSITSADDDYWNGGKGWAPIGDGTNPFTATFNGNNKTISNLFINSTDGTADIGLFGVIGKCDANGNNCSEGGIKNLGLLNASVTRNHTSKGSVGSLAGRLRSGEVISCYATGSVSHTTSTSTRTSNTGGLVGSVGNSGKVMASYATTDVKSNGGNVQGTRNRTGGLVGRNTGKITASYATGTVANQGGSPAGALVGYHDDKQGAITASYAIGATRKGTTNGGRLVHYRNAGDGSTVTNSYWDAGTTGEGVTTSYTNDANGKTTRELQSPTGYTGIYANWNVDLDNADGDNNIATGGDDPWDFGDGRQYPALKYGGLDPAQQRQTAIRSDNWNAPVVSERIVAKLTGGTGNWQWYRLDGDWTLIAGSATTGAVSSAYVPVTADVGKHLRAEVTFTASGKSQTLTTMNTAKVVAATTATAVTGAVAFVPDVTVGAKLEYAFSGSGTTDHSWGWQRCTNQAMTSGCAYVGDGAAAYRIVAADVGKYLQAYAYYAANDAGKTWTRTETPVLGPVVAAPAASP